MHQWDFTEEVLAGRRPGNPQESTHLWRANIPNNLKPGTHTIEVKATDMFGRTFTQKTSYRIEMPKTGKNNSETVKNATDTKKSDK